MLAAAHSAAVLGIDALDILVEVHVANGLPQWTLVGLAATAVKESRDRVSAALANSGFTIPPRRITVNLQPADMPKSGTAFDLPIALALLAASGQLPPETLHGVCAIGELGLERDPQQKRYKLRFLVAPFHVEFMVNLLTFLSTILNSYCRTKYLMPSLRLTYHP